MDHLQPFNTRFIASERHQPRRCCYHNRLKSSSSSRNDNDGEELRLDYFEVVLALTSV